MVEGSIKMSLKYSYKNTLGPKHSISKQFPMSDNFLEITGANINYSTGLPQ